MDRTIRPIIKRFTGEIIREADNRPLLVEAVCAFLIGIDRLIAVHSAVLYYTMVFMSLHLCVKCLHSSESDSEPESFLWFDNLDGDECKFMSLFLHLL